MSVAKKTEPVFPLLGEGYTVEQLEANRQYCERMRVRMEDNLKKLERINAREKAELAREIKALERHIFIHKIQGQPFYGKANKT